MKILIGCEYSGIVKDAFIEKGHDVFSCDLLENELHSKNHHTGDIFDLNFNDFEMLIAFPPCTHLALCGSAKFEEKRKDGRQQEGINFFMELINLPINGEPKYFVFNSKKTKTGKSKYSSIHSRGVNSKERSRFFPVVAKAMREQWNF